MRLLKRLSWLAIGLWCVLIFIPDILCSVPGYSAAVKGANWVYHEQALDWQGWWTVFLFFCALTALILEVLPPDIILLIGAGILVVTGVITPAQFLMGFSRDIIFTLAMLFIVAQALETNGLLNLAMHRILPKKTSHWRQLFTMMFPVSTCSAFMNNTPIVLMVMPIVRRWALENNLLPSLYLIPLSYAAIFGGICTLIGTSGNLVVDGLLRAEDPRAGFSFFELSWIGLPCALVGFVYLLGVGYRFLPDRFDPMMRLSEEAREFTSEFSVEEESPLVGLTVKEAGKRHFRGEFLIEIERESRLIDSPSADEVLHVDDRLIFAGDIKQIAELHKIKGLRSLADPHFHIDVDSSHFSEVVISITSALIGKTLRRIDFRNTYGASVIAIFRQGRRVKESISDCVLHAGDTLMLLSSEPWYGGDYQTNDFYYIRHNEEIPLYSSWRIALMGTILCGMIGLVLFGVPMVLASLTAALAVILSKSISIKEARKSIQWNLLVLIASSFAFGTALQKTGVASYLAETILPILGGNQYMVIGGIFLMTLVITEMITNNAAALMVFPIAVQTARLSGYDSLMAIKAVGVTVAVAASCSFMTPIGYQTNTIVYGPGGYRFFDYTKVGAPLSLLIFILATFLIPRLWPMGA